jgi:hypothetical protein
MDKIKKANLKKGRTLEITLTEIITVDQGTVENEVVKKCNYLAHVDLINAFEKLNEHLQSVCEIDGMVEDFKVSGFTYAGDGDEGVVITGAKKLSTGKFLNLVSPFIEFFGGDYGNADELYECIEICNKEVKAYLDGKCAVKQIEINFDESDEDSQVTISDGSAPKKKGRKKKVNIAELEIEVTQFQEAPEEFIEAV